MVAQTIASAGGSDRKKPEKRKLFSKAMASSPFWPKTYRYDSKENEALYEEVVSGVGCKGVDDEIACLKEVDVQRLRDVSLKLTTSLKKIQIMIGAGMKIIGGGT